MKIRKCNPGDQNLLAGLIRTSFSDVAGRFNLTRENAPTHPSLCTPEWISAAMDKGVVFYLLEEEGTALGCVALEQAGAGVCYLERLAVLPEHRRKGLASRLVAHALSRAGALGANRVEIALIAAQTELMEFYRGQGFIFREIKEFPHLPFQVAFMSMEI